MGGIDYAVSQIKMRLADKEQSGFRTWPERPYQGSQTKRCQYYNDVAKAKRIVMRNVLKTPLPNQRDVTIVTHTSLDRLDQLKRLMDHWTGPVSVAVHVRPEEVPDLSYHLVSLAVNTTNLQRLAIHLVFDLVSTVSAFWFMIVPNNTSLVRYNTSILHFNVFWGWRIFFYLYSFFF